MIDKGLIGIEKAKMTMQMAKEQISTGQWCKGVFSFPLRVYYEDCDVGGMVYHARYISFFERIRTESIRDTQVDVPCLQAVAKEQGGPFAYVVSQLNVKYKRQAFIGDILTGTTAVMKIRAASLALEQRLWRGHEEIAHAQLVLAMVNRTGRPQRWPEDMKKKWQDWHEAYQLS